MKSNVLLLILAGVVFIAGVFTQQTLIILIAVTLASIASFEDALRRYARMESPKARTRRRINALK